MAPPAEHLDILQPSPIAGVTGPHSRRVLSNSPGANAGPVNYTRPTSMYESSSSSSSSAHLPVPSRSPGTPKTAKIPPIPARSPLRPRPRAIVSSVQVLADARNLVAQVDDMPLTPNQSGYSSFANLLESMDLNDSSPRPPSKLPGRPDSNVLGTDLQPESGPSSSTSSLSQAPQTLSKRTHALLEMLTTERAYASDLALIRDVHVPLALGQPAPFQTNPATPPSSGSSTRTLSTASDSSTSSSSLGPPMTREDTRIIFSNVAELAMLSDTVVERLEEALGSLLHGGVGDDSVGALFLELIPALEPPYKTYITRHPTALAHLNSLPPSPALTAYLARSRELAASLTHAWDLPSLLIKPVQRLLKYSLLLTAIIAETPDSHPDKQNLQKAREKMEEVARGVNEDRRRWEVVKEVLNTKPGETKGKKGLNVGVGTSVNIGRMKSLRNGKDKGDSKEADEVAKMEQTLKRTDEFINQLAKDAVDWALTVRQTVRGLRQWALSFALVIGLTPDQKSEAFDAFLVVVEHQLTPLGGDLESIIRDKLLAELARLVDSMSAPLRLVEAMNTLEPLHYGLLNINFSKNRAPPQLLAASQQYLALRGQLYSELPQYLKLLDKGIATAVLQLSSWQTSYWADVRDRWGGLWDALRVDGEMNAGAEETERVWWGRWEEVANLIHRLTIVNPKKIYVEREKPTPVQTQTNNVISMLASLNAGYAAPPSTSPVSPRKLVSASSWDGQSLRNGRRPSKESMRSSKTGRSGRTKTSSSRNSRPEDFGEYAYISMPGPIAGAGPISMPMPMRTKSMPLGVPQGIQMSNSSESSRGVSMGDGSPGVHQAQQEFDFGERGRPQRKSSIRQKVSDSIRPSSRSSHRSIEATPPPPGTTTFYTSNTPLPKSSRHSVSSAGSSRSNLHKARALYACRVVHPCSPPDGVSYRNLPFFTLRVNAIFDVLREYGHPSLHEDLPLYVDDGEDCLLLVRDSVGEIGWSLASFLIPLD